MPLGLTHAVTDYQEYFLGGGKGGRCLRLKTLLFYVPIVLKSGSLTLLEPSGPVQACNGIALLLLVAGRTKAWVCCRSLIGIAGSNSAWDMNVCLL